MKKIIIFLFAVLFYGKSEGSVSVDAGYATSKKDTSSIINFQCTSSTTTNIVQIIRDTVATFNGNPQQILFRLYSVSGTFSDTTLSHPLVPATVYFYKVIVDNLSQKDSLIFSDTTLVTPPLPMKLGNFLASNIAQNTFLLTIDYLNYVKEGHILYLRQSDGAVMDLHDSIYGFSTDSVATITQAAGTTETYLAIGWNDLFPLQADTQKVTVTTKQPYAQMPRIDTLNMLTITSAGGTLRYKTHADSIGYTHKFEKSVNAGPWVTIKVIPYQAGTLDSTLVITGISPATSVCIRLTVSNSLGGNDDTICFQTTAITVVPPTFGPITGTVSGGYLNGDAIYTSNDPTGTFGGFRICKQSDTLTFLSIAGCTLEPISGGNLLHYMKTMGPMSNGSYYLQMYSYNSAAASFRTSDLFPFQIIASDIEEKVMPAKLELYPNPMISVATITSDKPGHLRVGDILGNVILEKNLISNEPFLIERNGIASGMYFYTFTGDTGSVPVVGRIVIQ